MEAAELPYPDFDDGKLRLLVTGGSQGARIFSDVVPAALGLLSPEQRARLGHRPAGARRGSCARRGGLRAAEGRFRGRAILPGPALRIAAAHLVIGRSGASTVSELAVIGRPVDPGAVSPCARRRPGGQRRPSRARPARRRWCGQIGFHAEWLAERLRAGARRPERLDEARRKRPKARHSRRRRTAGRSERCRSPGTAA